MRWEALTPLNSIGWRGAVNTLGPAANGKKPLLANQSAIQLDLSEYDAVVTGPPYYDAIPYADLMDFFHVWLRRSLKGLSPELAAAFRVALSPKWDQAVDDRELIDDASRHGGDRARSRAVYDDGMVRAFHACGNALRPDGRLVVVLTSRLTPTGSGAHPSRLCGGWQLADPD
jgi:adenine-specific DNA methylase